MARCEDFPCCGHDICPDYDENGQQMNMKCVCGATLPINSRFSICDSCMDRASEDDIPEYPDSYYDEDTELDMHSADRDRDREEAILEFFEAETHPDHMDVDHPINTGD